MKMRDRTYKTKRALANTFKKLLEKEPFSKITVSEIVENCGYNRKTFYYHFEDIYALLRWTFENETIDILRAKKKNISLEEAVAFFIDYADKNRAVITSAFESIGYERLKHIIAGDFYKYTGEMIEKISAEKELGQYKLFLSVYFAEAVTGTVITWIKGNMNSFTKEELTECIISILNSSVRSAMNGKASKHIHKKEQENI